MTKLIQSNKKISTRMILTYDTESDNCPKTAQTLVNVHEKENTPATFFILGTHLRKNSGFYKKLFVNSGLFDTGSHTFDHKFLRDNLLLNGKAVPDAEITADIRDGIAEIENTFSKKCLGFRCGFGYETGFRNHKLALKILSEMEISYTSTQLMGEDDAIPAELCQPYTYIDDGYPGIWEIPGNGWQDCVLKLNAPEHRRVSKWPPLFPGAMPPRTPKDPKEEFELHRLWLLEAVRRKLPAITFIFHPWSIGATDPKCEVIRLLIQEAKNIGVAITNMEKFHKELKNNKVEGIDKNGPIKEIKVKEKWIRKN